jgi:hypothetical protein
MLLGRGRWFRMVAVYLQEQLVNKIIQVFNMRSRWWRHDVSVLVPCWGHMCFGRLSAVVAV